jgi:O-succinylbenzoic acid--CoA ligase
MVLVRSVLAGSEPVELVGPTTVEAFEAATARLTGPRCYVSLVPTQLRRLVGSPALLAYDAVLLGGAAAPADLLDRARAAGVRVVTTYGMSETSGGCVYDGVPLPGVTVDAPDGRVRIAGPVVALGYRLRPDLTGEAFADGAFSTDDLGEVGPDGRLVVHGRADDVVVTGGEKVAPAAVEAVLRRHPAVAEVAVAGVPDDEWGARVVAVVVLRAGAALTLEQARAHVVAELPRAAAPRELRVVEALPLLASGKIDRMRLLG